MNTKLIATLFSVVMVVTPNLVMAASDSAPITTAMITPALFNPVTGKQLPAPIKICNDAKMACIPDVDTCCGGGACPSSGVCP